MGKRRELLHQPGLVFLGDADLDDKIGMVVRQAPGLDGRMGAVPADNLHGGFLQIIPFPADHQDLRRTPNGNLVKEQDGDGKDHRQRKRDFRKAGTTDDTRADGPEQKRQIHGFLDRGAEADDGKSADHTERHHHAGLDRHDDGARDQCRQTQGDVERLGIERLLGNETVQEEDVGGKEDGDDERHENADGRHVIACKRLEKRFLENVLEAHGPKFLSIQVVCRSARTDGTDNTLKTK